MPTSPPLTQSVTGPALRLLLLPTLTAAAGDMRGALQVRPVPAAEAGLPMPSLVPG